MLSSIGILMNLCSKSLKIASMFKSCFAHVKLDLLFSNALNLNCSLNTSFFSFQKEEIPVSTALSFL